MNKTENNKKKALSYLFGTVFIVFFIYFFSLFRPWQPFDERLIYNEELLPIPASFSEIFEIINSFVFNYHILSMNSFFSNCVTLRSNQLASILMVFISFFFKKSAFLYHLLQLFIHLINSALIFLIFKKSAEVFNGKKSLNNSEYLTISILTLIWALHSTNTEAILLVTNWTTLLTYTFCFLFLLYEISSIQRNSFVSITVLFGLSMFFTEYAYSLPLIIFFIVFSFALKNSYPMDKAITLSLKKSLPYFAGLFIYTLFSLTSSGLILNLTNKTSLYAFFERNLWLSPQIFMHFLKLLFFPKTLSTYQSNLIHLSDNLFSSYSVLCTSIYLSFLILPVVLFILFKKSNNRFLCPLIYCFYFSLFPFLHILTPTYCLIADRYCYFPLFFLLLFICQLFFSFNKERNLKSAMFFSLALLFALTLRTFVRIHEWKNPSALLQSAVNADKNSLYKAYKLILCANFTNRDKSLSESLRLLEVSQKILKKNIKNNSDEPLTLKLYGLDSKSLLLKTAFSIATIRNDYYNETPKSVLLFYEPYIKEHFELAGINQLLLYASILSKDRQPDNAKKILEYSLERYPYSPEIMKSLTNFYFYEKDLEKLRNILNKAYKLFPNDKDFIRMLYSYYKLTNDKKNETRFAYLIRLREHLTVTIK